MQSRCFIRDAGTQRRASDFSRFDGLASNPDFSTSGRPIQLGFRTATSKPSGGTFNAVLNYDNWYIRVHFVACPSDFTSDGSVDDSDFVSFAAAYSILVCADPTMPAGCPADLNSDGFIDDADFVLFAAAHELLECP